MIVGLAGLAICACQKEIKPISAFEFGVLVMDCQAKGGVPTPIYDKLDPEKVYSVMCTKPSNPVGNETPR